MLLYEFEVVMINRLIFSRIKENLFKGKAIIIYGARQVGKTTLVNEIIIGLNKKTILLNGDDTDTRELFEKPNIAKLQNIIANAQVVIIDEAQRITEIGIAIKIIVDRISGVQVIATGSSSFMLAEKTKEALAGRAYEYVLYPLSFQEIVAHNSFLDEKRALRQRILYGSYPEIVMKPEEGRDLLKLLTGSYLYRDITFLETVSNPELLEKITKALALQIGSEVSSTEISQIVNADRGTVEKYITLLEKAFVVFQLPSLNKNVRNEIKKGRKIYFVDNGVRNAILNNFTPLETRNDTGALWENYCISERRKLLTYRKEDCTQYFWRTTQQQEIDYIEENLGHFKAYEIKYSSKSKARISKTFLQSYSVTEIKTINIDNVEEFLL
ncbi:MAG: ATPase AAA [Ignavibacteria bacterium]|nr:MAG: ATPase AAA [Ignavibacteria bacterium]KAF0155888.1 MAG: ATPase AAA [Ignavibacteria bacterium]